MINKDWPNKVEIPGKLANGIQREIEHTLCARSYYLNREVGGKHWCIRTDNGSTKQLCYTNEIKEHMEQLLTLYLLKS